MRRPPVAYAALAFAALLFGGTFVVVKEAVVVLPPLAFVGWRFLIGAVALLLLGIPHGRSIWRDGLAAGVLLFAGFALQTAGLAETSASNSGLITGLYVVFTPLLAAGVARHGVSLATIAGTAVAFGGLALLTIGEGVSLATGDLLTVGCAVAFAGHIVVLSRVAFRHPVIPFTAIQLLVTALLALAGSALLEGFPLPTGEVMPSLFMTGLVVSGGAFILQVWSQTVIGPARTAIILALEPAFAAAFGAWLLAERLDTQGWIGAGLILAGIYVVLASTGDRDDLPAAEAVTPAH
ncbi:MAG: DMT family transporter [Acidimicrobiia bacterium]|nr:DMT family transporter [Acidimicrobiia bacterium]MDH3396466.1 DMT family transporter [Acidimicrobiia bacterium]MDH5615733.1 DMT family transporter [Acidimicrobiia bacterium]